MTRREQPHSDDHQAAHRQFVTDVANELRTPLNAIICLTRALPLDCPGNVACSDDLNQIQACAWELSAAVDRMLDFLATRRFDLRGGEDVCVAREPSNELSQKSPGP